MMRGSFSAVLSAALLLGAAFFLGPFSVDAQSNICPGANTTCGGPESKGKPCSCTVVGYILVGACGAPEQCHVASWGPANLGTSGATYPISSGLPPSLESALNPSFFSQAGSFLQQNPILGSLGISTGFMLLQQLQSGAPSGSSGGSGISSGSGCASFHPSSVPTSDPCAYYLPSLVSSTSSTSTAPNISDLLDRLLKGPAATSSAPVVASSTLSASPSSGTLPLSVSFTTGSIRNDAGSLSIDFGDGSSARSLSAKACTSSVPASCARSASHIYAAAGTYTATLLLTPASCALDIFCAQTALATVDVTATSESGQSGSLTPTSTSTDSSPLFSVPVPETPPVSDTLLSSPLPLPVPGNSFVLSPSLTPTPSPSSAQPSASGGGLQGNIALNEKGGTIFASSEGGGSAVAGFYGSDVSSGQAPQGVVGNLCEKRPWTGGVLSVIPSSFFDNLCTWGGYRVGPAQTLAAPPSAPAPPASTIGPTAAPPPQALPSNPNAAPPEARIWAEPASVSLGGRTTIFWTSQNTTSCEESSSDGNFTGNSLSGGASTVALSGATTFVIRCVGLNGASASNQTTVTLGI